MWVCGGGLRLRGCEGEEALVYKGRAGMLVKEYRKLVTEMM